MTKQISNPEERWKFASAISKADLVPKQFHNKPANVFLALDMSERLGITVFEVMQNIYIVHGTPAFSAKYSIALANHSGKLKGPIQYAVEGKGETMAVTAYATVRETDQKISFTVTWAMAKAEGWTKNSKYKTMPDLMLRYRAASLLIRTHMPEVTLGMHTREEIEDVQAAREVPAEVTKSSVLALNEEVSSNEEEEETAPVEEEVNPPTAGPEPSPVISAGSDPPARPDDLF
jgi:hypothetical protein